MRILNRDRNRHRPDRADANIARDRTVLRGRQRGFTLVELLVAVGISIGILVGILALFDTASELARVQTSISDLQQSSRIGQREITRIVRLAGRGGLPHVLPQPLGGLGAAVVVSQGTALALRNNVGLSGVDDDVAMGFANSPKAVQGSDILTVRGVITTPVYQVPATAGASTLVLRDAGGTVTTDPAVATSGTILVTDPGPTGIPQDLSPIAKAIADGVPEALILTGLVADTIFAVVELAAGSSVDDPNNPTAATLNFSVIGGAYTTEYRTLYNAGGGNLPSAMTSVAFIGIVEEYRFYVRARRTIPGNAQSQLIPTLSKARMIPGSEIPYRSLLSEAQIDIADNFLNLQVAMAFDSSLGDPLVDRNGDGLVNDDDIDITETANGNDDDWLFNGPGDNVADPTQPWTSPWDDDPNTAALPKPILQTLRVTALVRSERPERTYEAPELINIEDLFFSSSPMDVWNNQLNTKYRRRTLLSDIDLRNL